MLPRLRRWTLTEINAAPGELPNPAFMTNAGMRFLRAPFETDGATKHSRVALLVGAVIVALQVLDVLTTLKVIAAGGSELNPVISTLIRLFGPAWWVPKVVLASCVAGYFATRPRISWRVVVILILCVIVVLNNFAQLLS